MKWARVEHNGTIYTGRVEGSQITPVAAHDPLTACLGDPGADIGDPWPASGVKLLSPIVPIRNVFCVGWNYLPHFEEGAVVHGERPLPDRPNFFTKTTTAVIGPNDDIARHDGLTEKLDWEVELGAVIGKRTVDVDSDGALDAVAAYVVAQDITARDVQHAHGGQWFRGKSLDASCPVGPWLVDASDIPDPQDLEIWTKVNGIEKQRSNTRHMIFSIARLIAELSRGLTLLPGDLLLTGTPEGVGQSRTPPQFLRHGDLVESGVEGVGALSNRVSQ